jgi:pyruvate formate lyase activating enzyme
MKGLIFSIKRYSVHDGPGIRVTFFMKGCPLSCWWCHNPEGISSEPETVDQIQKVGEKEFRVEEKAGKYYTPDEIVEILEKEKIFISESKGGVTFSGGEPLLQPEFLLEVLNRCKSEGFHTAVDTSGYAKAEQYMPILQYTDLLLFDIKHLDDIKHFRYTGVSNDLILNNLKLILDNGKDVWLRVPVVPGINDDSGHLEMLKSFIVKNKCSNLKKINLLSYHKIGSSKYKKFRVPYRMNGIEQPSSSRMQELKKYFEETGIKVKIGG